MTGDYIIKVFIIGITGLLGSAAARELIKDGHKVSGLSRGKLSEGFTLEDEITLVFGNYLDFQVEDFARMFTGFDGFIFASGIDERVKTKQPAYETFNYYNVAPLEKMLKGAKIVGIKHVVILGSYFTYFDEKRPHLRLRDHHPYIRSRVLQKEMALSYATDDFHVAILELPYVFGVQDRRKPVWVFLAEMILKMGPITFFSTGGTSMVTTRQVGQAVRGALIKNEMGYAYPIGYYNLKWKTLLKAFHLGMEKPKQKIMIVPNFIFKFAMKRMQMKTVKNGYEGGLNLTKFAAMQCSYQFINKEEGALFLGVEEDDILLAIKASAALSMKVIRKQENAVSMDINE